MLSSNSGEFVKKLRNFQMFELESDKDIFSDAKFQLVS